MLCKKCGRIIKDRHANARFCSDDCSSQFFSKKRYNELKDNDEFKEYHKKRFKIWYAKNKKRHFINIKRNFEAHREEWRMRSAVRHYRKELIELKGGRCQKCGSKEKLQLHHIKYIRLPGIYWKWTERSARIKFYDSITELLCFCCHRNVTKRK